MFGKSWTTWELVGSHFTPNHPVTHGSPDAQVAPPASTMWREILHSGFETCLGLSAQGAGIRYQNTSQIQILLASHFEKKRGSDVVRS